MNLPHAGMFLSVFLNVNFNIFYVNLLAISVFTINVSKPYGQS